MFFLPYTILAIIMEVYLIYMAKEDVRGNRTVPITPGYICMGVCGALYLLGCLFTLTIPNLKLILYSIIFIGVLWLFKVYGKGDAKAFFAITLLSAYTCNGYGIIFHDIDVSLPVLTYLIAVSFSVPIGIVRGLKNGKKLKDVLFGRGERIAFFPYIATGFGISSAIYILRSFLYYGYLHY